MLTVFRILYGLLAVVKTLSLIASGAVSMSGGFSLSHEALIAFPVGAAMLIAEAFFLRGKGVRVAALIMAAGFFTFILALGLYNHHTYLLAAIAVIFAIGVHEVFLLKMQMSVVYFYAAITKLNETYLSGTELYASMVGRPLWQVLVGVEPAPAFLMGLAGLSILVEGFLGFGFWFRRTRWVALVVGAGFHLTLIAAMTRGLESGLNLGIYGFALMAFYVLFFPREVGKLRERVRPSREPEPVTA